MTTRVTQIAASIFVMLLVFAVVGEADMQEMARQHEEYCDNVQNHVWPDFNKNFNKVCK